MDTMAEIDSKDMEKISLTYLEIKNQLKQRIVGLEDAILQIIVGIFSGNHILLVGVPGLAKTLLIRSIAELLNLKFSRIQFTPDLMPSDITGTELLVEDIETKKRQFAFAKGPLFANILLADEINRTPPKTQSALLEGMEEGSVTSAGKRFELDPPFLVLATQNPIEQEGTYPLPAAQLDRFMFNILFDYPSQEEEYHIVRLTVAKPMAPLKPILNKEDLLHFTRLVRKIHIPAEVMQYALLLCRRSRPQNQKAPEVIRENLAWGASPRAAQGLIIGGKTLAMLEGRKFVTPRDIQAISHPVLRHRIILNYKAEADGLTPDEIIDRLIQSVPSPDGSHRTIPRRQYMQKLYVSPMNR